MHDECIAQGTREMIHRPPGEEERLHIGVAPVH